MIYGLCADARNVCYVNDDGALNWNDCDYDNGVRPFWWNALKLIGAVVSAIRHKKMPKGERHIKRAHIPSHGSEINTKVLQ